MQETCWEATTTVPAEMMMKMEIKEDRPTQEFRSLGFDNEYECTE